MEKLRRPASVSKGDWCGNNTRIGLVGFELDFDFGFVALPSRGLGLPLRNYLLMPWTLARTVPKCPNFCSTK